MKNKKLYEDLIYLFYCAENDLNPQYISTIENYKEMLKDSEYHFGDCTKDACMCIRCHMQQYEILAQNAYNFMKLNDYVENKDER